jgi:membrane protease subunit HflK
MNKLPQKEDGVTVSLRLGARIVAIALTVTLLAWLASGLTTLEHDEQAVVLRWGSISEVRATSGTLWAFPAPIGEVIRLPAKERQFELQVPNFGPSVGYVLTGDAKVLHLHGTLTWSVSEPKDYFRNAGDRDSRGFDRIERTLARLYASAAVRAALGHDVERLLIGEQRQLQEDIIATINNDLATTYQIGVRVHTVTLDRSLPTLAQEAYDRTVEVKAEADQRVAAAKQSASRVVAVAQTEADRMLADARARRQEIVATARASVSPVVAAQALSDQQDPRTLRERIYREYLDTILTNTQLQVVDPQPGVLLYLQEGR